MSRSRNACPNAVCSTFLVNVEHLTNFTNHFGPASGSEPKIEQAAERYILTVFAIGSNLGPVQAARHLQGVVTAHMLSFANRKHVTVEKLDAARRELIEFYLKLDLPKAWGNGTMVGADGTQFDFYENNLLAGYHFRYRKMGAVAYRHVADNYIAVFCDFVPPGIWEGIYVIDALMQPQLSIQADAVCSDTQGQSAVGFAFARMFAIRLLPRIRNWKDLKLYRPSARVRYRHIDSLFSETVDWKPIREHWKDWMQLILSVQAGKVSSSTLIRQLSHRSQANPLARFAEAFGDVERTMFLLTWISDQTMRQQVTAVTNKGEGYHGFSKWLSFGGEVITENDPDEQQKHIRYNDLLASAVILQNVIDMTRIIEDLRGEGWTITDEDLSFISPYLQGAKRFGEYVLDLDVGPDPKMLEILSRQKNAPLRAGSRGIAKEARVSGEKRSPRPLIDAGGRSDSDCVWRVRVAALAELRSYFDTRQILRAVDEMDRFCGEWKRELRDDLLKVHAMAHTVINGAPLARLAGKECLTAAAYEVAGEFREWQQALGSAIALLDQIADLALE